MSHRINVLIDDQLWEDLRQIPKGERSRLINESLAERLKQKKRERLLEEMQATAKSAEPSGEDAVTLLRRQRYRLHPGPGDS
jgi:post-segregation antitoxin (ccd killing protein)